MKAPTLLAFLGLTTAQAAEPTGTLTLACEGTTRLNYDDADEPSSMGIIVNFAARTVTGFRYRDSKYDYIPVAITDYQRASHRI